MIDFNTVPIANSMLPSEPVGGLPAHAGQSFNHCNLPTTILGSQTFQVHPVPLTIDCVAVLHGEIFRALADIASAGERALHFNQYMRSAFLLDNSDEAGFTPKKQGVKRNKSDYLRLLRGWMFNPDGIEGAVLKRWVESRFGLRALNHGGLLDGESSCADQAYHSDYVRGLYNTNALEAQLDLLYSYCQYELHRRYPTRTHWQLYRGVNHINQHQKLASKDPNQLILLLNNLNSFSCDRYSAETFGDVILETQVPVTKLLYFPELLTGVLHGENEYMVIGGVYQSAIIR